MLKIASQTPENAGLFHGIEGTAGQIVVHGEQKCLLLGELVGLVNQGRNPCLPSLLGGTQALGARHKLKRR